MVISTNLGCLGSYALTYGRRCDLYKFILTGDFINNNILYGICIATGVIQLLGVSKENLECQNILFPY